MGGGDTQPTPAFPDTQSHTHRHKHKGDTHACKEKKWWRGLQIPINFKKPIFSFYSLNLMLIIATGG